MGTRKDATLYTTVGVPSIAPIAELSVNGCDVTPAAGRDICHVRALFPIDVCDVSTVAAGRDFSIVIRPFLLSDVCDEKIVRRRR